METTDETLLDRIDRYIEKLFPAPNGPSGARAEAMKSSDAQALPAIQVSANQGKLLYLVAKVVGAERILELDATHAAVARANVAAAGLSDLVEIREGDAKDLLREIIRQGAPPFDLIFIDADKTSYVEYLDLGLQPGTVILADNVIRGGKVIDDSPRNGSMRARRRITKRSRVIHGSNRLSCRSCAREWMGSLFRL